MKRFVRTIAPTRRAVGVFHCAPGAGGQLDFFRGAPTLDAGTGEWRRPWVFRMTLSHSRHGYEEAVWDQTLETFLRLHECAFRDLGGVPAVIRLDDVARHIIVDDHAHRPTEATNRTLVELRPDLRARLPQQQTDRFARVAERQDEEPGAPVRPSSPEPSDSSLIE